jgi:hypothetical protein
MTPSSMTLRLCSPGPAAHTGVAQRAAVLPIVVAQLEVVSRSEVVPPIVAVRSSAVEPL